MTLNLEQARQLLQGFEFSNLFVEQLGWSRPAALKSGDITCNETTLQRRPIAQLAGVAVFEILAGSGKIPDAATRAAVHKQISAHHHENLLIFVDARRTQSLWYWVKRHNGKAYPRDHIYVQGQPGDLFLSKLNSMVVDLGDFDESGDMPLFKVTSRLKEALDVERVTKRFYAEFAAQHLAFLDLIEGIDDARDRHWYASVLLNRLMFIYFLQRKFFLDNGNGSYLQAKLAWMKRQGNDLYYENFLKPLFFEGFAKPHNQRRPEINRLLGRIKYLNGGLFLQHPIELHWPGIAVPDRAFDNLFNLFERYSWNLNDTPGGLDNEINPDVLGYIFEKYINQKTFGAYYTRTEITGYLCDRTIHRLILDRINHPGIPGVLAPRRFDSIGELLLNLDSDVCRALIFKVLPGLRLLDPACGSAAFLVAAMKTLINIYAAVVGKIEFLNDPNLSQWLTGLQKAHPSINYFIKKQIITANLFGVDIMEEAVEIAKLRLFLALVAAASNENDLEPLPNIDFNILAGNSLIGLLRVDEKQYESHQPKRQLSLFHKSYRQIVDEKNRLVGVYRDAATYADDLRVLRDQVEAHKQQAVTPLNEVLLAEFNRLKITYEQPGWDNKKQTMAKPVKRALEVADIRDLKPFHWGFEFDEILNHSGGFDAIITNPPWEIFKPNAKEFFETYSDLVTKKKMTIKDFEKEQVKLLKDTDVRKAWVGYLAGFPHVSAFFRGAPQFRNQISIINGKKAGTDINLYKLFLEQCFNLLKSGGCCGIVIPSGIYTDLGAKQLREMLFRQTRITGLFGFENRKEIFEGVHRSFKFVVLSFEKDNRRADPAVGANSAGQYATESFPAAFMRTDVKDLERFPQEGAIDVAVDLVRRLAPDSLSIMEFKNPVDVKIVTKMFRFPLLGETMDGKWNVRFTAEFHMTNDSHLFKTEPAKGRLPLYEGKMVHQFTHRFLSPRYWIDEKAGRANLLGRSPDKGRLLDYQACRLGFRDIARNTDERTLIATILPPTFHGNKFPTVKIYNENGQTTIDGASQLFLCALWNSFTLDYIIRMRVTTTLNFFYIYQMPVPRLTKEDPAFGPIVHRSARLICTAPEFDDLARQAGMTSHREGAIDPAQRARLRAELDGLVAHLYGLSEEQFAHILTTFPLVADPVKIAAHNAFRNVEKGLIS